jgi:hypothetical protein
MYVRGYLQGSENDRVVTIGNIDCGQVNIPDKLRHSKRHVIQSSFSFSFNNQRSNNFP